MVDYWLITTMQLATMSASCVEYSGPIVSFSIALLLLTRDVRPRGLPGLGLEAWPRSRLSRPNSTGLGLGLGLLGLGLGIK